MKSPLSIKHQAAILGDIYMRVNANDAMQDENWRNFINNNDIAFPFSFMYSMQLCEFSNIPEQREFVEEKIRETFAEICEYLNLNIRYPWQTADQMFSTTSNYSLPLFDADVVVEIEEL